jgi:hypothetical protein
MKSGPARFDFYIDQLQQLLLKASAEKNPALWLYSNNARTPIFMLEGLSKLYACLHNEKRFAKIKEQFKLMEDTLGAIDYYDCFAKEFIKDEKIPAEVANYMQAQAREKTQRLNDILIENKWMGDKPVRIKKICEKLSGADWMQPKEEVKAILNFYLTSIEEIKRFASSTGYHFTELEAQVHALRRKLRWLSIYTTALQGLIQLTDSNIKDEKLSKYLLPEIINSPFNKLPDVADNEYLLLFEKNYFLALSWIIAALGKLKDNGLRIMAIAEALQQTSGIDQNEAMQQACRLLNEEDGAISKILSQASQISRQFFEEAILDKLIHATVSVKK